MKKAIRILVAAVLVMALCATSAFAASAPVVSAEKVTGETGKEVTVDVSIKNNPGFASYNIVMNYDNANLELVDLVANTAIGGIPMMNAAAGEAGFMNATDINGDAVLFTATFKVLGEGGEYAVTPEIIQMVNAQNADIGATAAAGSVTVEVEQEEPPVDPQPPVDPEDPVVPEDPATPVNPEDPATAPNAGGNDGPKTGDDFSVVLFGGVALAALAAAAGTLFVRRRNN